MPLEAILAADQAISIHLGADDMGTYVACGGIGGNHVGEAFVMGLGPVAASGYSGITSLTDSGGGTTDVQVAIRRSGAGAVATDDDNDDIDDGDGSDDDRSSRRVPRLEPAHPCRDAAGSAVFGGPDRA